MSTVLIVGCGYLGRQVADLLSQPVTGLVRRPSACQRLIEAGIEPALHDLDQGGCLQTLPIAGSELYYFAPPPGAGESDPRLAGFFAGILPGSLPRKVVYVSTSAVYGDCGGRWIDESATLVPGTARGKRRLHAEQAVLAWGRHHRVPVVILRVAGIYGPGKLPVQRLRQGLPVLRAEDSPYTNRIHVFDLAQSCIAAMRCGAAGEAYNVADGHPSTLCDYFMKLAAHLGLPPPPVLTRAEAADALSPGMLSFLQESKRLSNRKLLGDLKVRLRYPDLARGLASIPGGA